MSADLEVRLARVLAAPLPSAAATERVRQAVVCAEVQVRRRRRGRLILGGLAAACATAGAGMAASGHLPIIAHPVSKTPPRLVVPHGTPAVATLAGGRAWVASRSNGTISRVASAVELSPAGRFVAFGQRGALEAADLGGDVRWRIPVAGEVVSIAWAPYPTYIAYIVGHDGRYDLRVIWANGWHDRLLARDVALDAPRWRPDTGALFYTDVAGTAWTWQREADRRVRTTRGRQPLSSSRTSPSISAASKPDAG